MKYKLTYTVTDPKPGEPIYRYEPFKTKKAAKEWLRKNKALVYWHQLTLMHPKSKLPLPIINFDPGSVGYTKKIGTLQTHFETGMEQLGLILYEDGVHGPPNPNFDPKKPEGPDNFQFYGSYDAMTFIKNGHVIEFEDGTRVGMLKDHKFAQDDGYRLSFYPQGYSRNDWLKLFQSERLRVTLWEKPKA